ncbi:HpcH/HpaI aldolase/citrate lyase family protein [Streptomyces griseus]|uniref:HpcH/HpaI aldolase/citrate lyase family protein n=1 Tax=Streptomyces griseus TaxID=1911 RepID=UPI0037F285D4
MRTALYVPADRPDMLAKALGRGADGVIVDLEDAVAPEAREHARDVCAAWLQGIAPAGDRPDGPEIWVRVNQGARGRADARAVASPALTGLVVAKTERVGDLVAVAAELEGAPWISLCPLLESAAALLSAPLIARGPRVARLQLGEADLCADTGISPGPDGRELLWPRAQLVLASAAAGLAAPLAPVATDFRDLDALRRSTEALRRLGFGGRSCIHPAQIPVVNDVFTPGPAEVERARALLRRSEEKGAGATSDGSGHMIDEAVLRGARRTIAAAARRG